MNLYIRKMTLEDIPAVVALDQVSFSLPWPERSFRFELTDNAASRCWVADVNARVVGMVVGWLLGARPAYLNERASLSTSAARPSISNRDGDRPRGLMWHFVHIALGVVPLLNRSIWNPLSFAPQKVRVGVWAVPTPCGSWHVTHASTLALPRAGGDFVDRSARTGISRFDGTRSHRSFPVGTTGVDVGCVCTVLSRVCDGGPPASLLTRHACRAGCVAGVPVWHCDRHALSSPPILVVPSDEGGLIASRLPT